MSTKLQNSDKKQSLNMNVLISDMVTLWGLHIYYVSKYFMEFNVFIYFDLVGP